MLTAAVVPAAAAVEVGITAQQQQILLVILEKLSPIIFQFFIEQVTSMHKRKVAISCSLNKNRDLAEQTNP